MNARKLTMIAAALIFGLFTVHESALAQEEGVVAQSQDFSCYSIKAKAQDTWPGAGNVSTGVFTNSGLLNGTTQYVFDTDAFSTPDPNTVTFGAELTLTTNRGVVKARVLNLFNLVTGIWTAIVTIDPNTSTGRFVGARGTFWYPNGTTVYLDGGGQLYPSDVTGHVCLSTHGRDKADRRE